MRAWTLRPRMVGLCFGIFATVAEFERELIRDRVRSGLALARAKGSLFTREGNKPVRDFRGAWQAICIAAGLGRTVCPDCDGAISGDRTCEGCSRKWKRRQFKVHGVDLPRPSAERSARDGPRWSPRTSGDVNLGPQDAKHIRQVQHR